MILSLEDIYIWTLIDCNFITNNCGISISRLYRDVVNADWFFAFRDEGIKPTQKVEKQFTCFFFNYYFYFYYIINYLTFIFNKQIKNIIIFTKFKLFIIIICKLYLIKIFKIIS